MDRPLLMDRTMTEDRIRVLEKARVLHSPSSYEEYELDNGEDELLCPRAGCLGDPQRAALDYLIFRHFRSFSDAISDDKFDPSYIYENETTDEDRNGKNLLEIALLKSPGGRDRFVETLILHPNATRVDEINELLETSPLHEVARRGDPELLRLVLEAGFPYDVNIPDGEGLTPLHVVVESLEEADDAKRTCYLKCMELLLNGEHIEPNAEDLRGNLTPLHYAANIGLQQPIRLLLDRGADPNLEFESGVTISDVIKRKIPEFDLADYVYKIKSRPLKSRLFEYVENGDIRGLESVKDEACELWNSDNGIVRWLLTVGGADPNARSGGEPRTPILIAAHHGYYRILRIFRDEEPRSDFTIIEPVSGKTVSPRGSNYRKCFDILLSDTSSKGFKDQIDSIINYREALDGDTPLHYATMQTDQDLIRAFLRRGANMGIKNKKRIELRILKTKRKIRIHHKWIEDLCQNRTSMVHEYGLKRTPNASQTSRGIVPKNEDGTPVQVVDTLFQMGVSFKRYFFNVENLLELTVIALSITIIFGSNSTPEEILMNRHLAALCVLFTWTELLVLIGRHPKLSTNIVMFRTVIGTFLTFLLWYSLIMWPLELPFIL
ncbi:unnamed protein product [Lepeophtheirus salmonis]|uniref:(salmon louse) hypothetical protein n=2 Tax=Lepeophtheirus salmonis TaxID=72036 RepID=A0A7R8H578_LEPSM|nr:unnamed protein product [Lepeophtheirus salmonis]CAF2873532.1 unnamed protein product [Lepeophtheirus salmonis]